MPRSSTSAQRGRVVEFDGHRGLGVVETDDGTEFPFHCTQIVDDSRTIDIGATVEFVVIPGGIGRWEAGRLVKLAG